MTVIDRDELARTRLDRSPAAGTPWLGAWSDGREIAEEVGTEWGARLLAAFVAALPMVVDPGGWFPYLTLRWAVMVVVAVALGLWVVIGGPRRAGWPTSMPASVRWWVALGVALAAATIASPSPRAALVGAIDRRFGALTWLAHGVLFVTAVVVVRRPAHLRTVARGMVVGTLATSVFTIVQQLGWDFPAHAVNRARPGGPFGNADVLGVYLVLGILVAVGVALDRRVDDRWRITAMITAALALATAAATGARGGWVGLAVGVVALAWTGSRRSGVAPRRRVAVIGALLVVLVAVLGASGTLGRVGHVVDGTARGRVDTWVVAVHAVAERPVLGWGPDGLVEGMQHHVDADYERTYTRRLLPDRAHSLPLDVAGSLGIVGLVAWLGVVLATGRGVVGGVRRDGSWLGLAMACGLAGLAVAELTLFPTFDVDAIGWIVAGALVGLGVGARRSGREGIEHVGRSRRVPVIVAGLVAGSVLVLAVTGVLADRSARRAADDLALGRTSAALGAARQAVHDDPAQPMTALLVSQAAVASGSPSTIDAAMSAVDRVRRSSIDDGRLTLAEGQLLAACQGRCEAQRGRVQRLADRLVTVDPARSDGWRLEAQLAEDRHDLPVAAAARLRVVDLAPDQARAWRELSITLRAGGDDWGAQKAALRAVQLDPGDDANLRALGS